MITLILGKKGSGKTKRLIDMCNSAVADSNGNVVFIEKDNNLTYDISHKARLAVAEDYAVKGYESLYGLSLIHIYSCFTERGLAQMKMEIIRGTARMISMFI